MWARSGARLVLDYGLSVRVGSGEVGSDRGGAAGHVEKAWCVSLAKRTTILYFYGRPYQLASATSRASTAACAFIGSARSSDLFSLLSQDRETRT